MNSILGAFILDKKHRQPDSYLYVNYTTGKNQIYSLDALPAYSSADKLRILILGDTHDRHAHLMNLPPCDLFIHCGDILMVGRYFSMNNVIQKLEHFNEWLNTIPAKMKIVIAGNHDHHFTILGKEKVQEILFNGIYLENSGVEFQNIRIWGSPISSGKSQNTAFQGKHFHDQTMEACPPSTDILITHGYYEDVQVKVKHKLHVCGHKHNSYGVRTSLPDNSILSICAPIHDGHFRLQHRPVIIDYPIDHDNSTSTYHGRTTSLSGISEQNLIPVNTVNYRPGRKKFKIIDFLWKKENQSKKIIPLNLSSKDESENS